MATLTRLINETRLVQIGQIVDSTHGGRMPCGKWQCGAICPVLSHINRKAIAATGPHNIKEAR